MRMALSRPQEIRRRRQRHRKLARLRERLAAAKTEAERQRLLAKLVRVAPSVSPDAFLGAAKAKAKASS